MKNKTVGRICNGILAGIMAMSMMAAPAFADVRTSATIDTAQDCTITIYKVFDATGYYVESDGLEHEIDMTPISGVEFSKNKIGDIRTVQKNGTIGVYYEITRDFEAFLTQQQVTMTPDTTVNDVNYYKAETIERALKELNQDQTAVENWVHDNGDQFTKTDADGMTTTTIEAANQGLYLIAETDDSTAQIAGNALTGDDSVNEAADGEKGNDEVNNDKPQNENAGNTNEGEMFLRTDDLNNGEANGAIQPDDATIASKIAPYLISAPMTTVITTDGAVDVDAEGQTQWLYDIFSYPKNSTTEITKKIIDPDESDEKKLRDQEDYQIGDNIEQVIWTGVSPLRQGKLHKKFVVKDTMTEGLKFVRVTKVTLGNKVSNPEDVNGLDALDTLQESAYTVEPTNNNHEFTVTLTAAGLAALDELTEDSTLAIFFDSTLVSEAKIGTDPENMNQPTLTWQNTGVDGEGEEAEHEITGNKVYDFTYEIDLTKTGLEDMTKAKFEVYKATFDTTRQKTEGNTIADNASYADPETLGDPVAFVEEEAGVYHIFDNDDDTEADATTVLTPDANGSLKMKGVDSETYTIREIQTENGKNLLKTTFDITITAPDEGRNGHCSATLSSDGDTTDLEAENGIISITVDNFKGVVLHTGGAGRKTIYMIGVIAAAALAAGYLLKKRNAKAA